MITFLIAVFLFLVLFLVLLRIHIQKRYVKIVYNYDDLLRDYPQIADWIVNDTVYFAGDVYNYLGIKNKTVHLSDIQGMVVASHIYQLKLNKFVNASYLARENQASRSRVIAECVNGDFMEFLSKTRD